MPVWGVSTFLRNALEMAQWLDPLTSIVRQAPWLTLVWIAVLGSCIGSFLNVVVYRLPRGKSLLHPGSHCPSCGHPIRWHDNLPVLGWIGLRGRCRDCHANISARYPLIEALVMLLFATQWIQDVWPTGLETDSLEPAVFAFVWHVSLLCSLVCAALIDFDGYATPRSLLIVGASVPLLMAGLSPAAASGLLEIDDTSVWAEIASGAAFATLVTFLLTWVLGVRALSHANTRPDRWTPLALSAMSGMYLGPERAVATLLLTTLLWRLLQLVRRSTGGAPWTWYLAALCWVAVVVPIE
jgi:prepilin signal peptidase PulO-like enzyme (type II secretory pathway)